MIATSHESIWGAGVQLHSLFTSALDGEWLISRSDRFTPVKELQVAFE